MADETTPPTPEQDVALLRTIARELGDARMRLRIGARLFVAADLSAIATRLEAMGAAVARVRALHAPEKDGWCDGCDLRHPCPTIRALNGAPEATHD